jgi:hypothetical protein
MNAGIFDHRVSSVAVGARATVIQIPVHAHRLASNAKYVTSVLIDTKNGWLCQYIV